MFPAVLGRQVALLRLDEEALLRSRLLYELRALEYHYYVSVYCHKYTFIKGVSQRTPPPMRACEHCQFGSAAKRAIAILVARNSNWHICTHVSILTDVSDTQRDFPSIGNVVHRCSSLQDVIDVLLAVSDCAMLLLITGNSVAEELLHHVADGETLNSGDGLYLDHNLNG